MGRSRSALQESNRSPPTSAAAMQTAVDGTKRPPLREEDPSGEYFRAERRRGASPARHKLQSKALWNASPEPFDFGRNDANRSRWNEAASAQGGRSLGGILPRVYSARHRARMPPPMSKLTSLHDAVAAHVHDGDLIYAAGFTHLIPFAAGHEIIRQGRRQLVLARATPDLIYDQMVAAGCARKIIFSYSGNPGIGSLRIVRTALEAGTLEWEEYSHFAMISRLMAGASGVPFMPVNPTGVDDLARVNPNYRTVADPYSGREVVTVPALNPD